MPKEILREEIVVEDLKEVDEEEICKKEIVTIIEIAYASNAIVINSSAITKPTSMA